MPRRFRTVPIGGKQVFIELPIQRVLCFDCCKTRQVKIGFADPRFGYTRSFERYALDLSPRTTIQHAAEHLKVGWDTIKDIQKRNLHRPLAKQVLKGTRWPTASQIRNSSSFAYSRCTKLATL